MSIKVKPALGKLQVLFYGLQVCTTDTQAIADAVCKYLRSVDTESKPGPARMVAIKRNAAQVIADAHAANVKAGQFAPGQPAARTARKAVRA